MFTPCAGAAIFVGEATCTCPAGEEALTGPG